MKLYTKKQLIEAIEILIKEYSEGIHNWDINKCSLCKLVNMDIKSVKNEIIECDKCINIAFGYPGGCADRIFISNNGYSQEYQTIFWTNMLAFVKKTPFENILPMTKEVKEQIIKIAEESYK